MVKEEVIKNLEKQEPCDDAISRQAMLEIQVKYAEHMGATKFWQMRDEIKKLPPVNSQEPNNDTVSRGVFEQVMWERDVAIEQLKDLGYELGEKPKAGHWIDVDGDNAICGCCNRLNHFYGAYCKHCGAKMLESQESRKEEWQI